MSLSTNNSHSQGIYTQLPQSLSDSDSDTEINDLKEIKHRNSRKILQNGLNLNKHSHDNGFALPQHVVKRTRGGFRAMSTARKLAFIFSILLCVFVIIIFLWVLPCSSNGTCPTKIGSWKVEHEGIELCGRINVISQYRSSGGSLALLARKSLNKYNTNAQTQSGAIALQTVNGAVWWFVPQVRTPNEMNCDMLDANRDEIHDCLLLSEMGLQAVDAIRGDILWSAHNSKMVIKDMDFPTALPDLNGDQVNDLISVIDWHNHDGNEQHNKVILICGRTGELLTSIVLHMCDTIDDFKYADEELLIFNCKNASHGNYYKISIGNLQKRIAYKNSSNSYPVQATKIQYVPERMHPNEYDLNGRKLIVENSGTCPGADCKTNVALFDMTKTQTKQKSHKPSRLLGWDNAQTYVMPPIRYSFNANNNNNKKVKDTNLNGHLNGFIMKLWQWHDINFNSNNHNATTTLQKYNVSEKVVLISFSDNNFQVINISLVQITQLCFEDGVCQPSLHKHNDSLLLTDLDADGKQELINYSSTYKCGAADDDSTCRLVSKMEVVQLETEMAKLYAV